MLVRPTYPVSKLPQLPIPLLPMKECPLPSARQVVHKWVTPAFSVSSSESFGIYVYVKSRVFADSVGESPTLLPPKKVPSGKRLHSYGKSP